VDPAGGSHAEEDSSLGLHARRPSATQGAVEAPQRLFRKGYAPLYFQLVVILEDRVESGEYATGQRFPSEHELCREFNVSRTVVRPAIAILEREGRVARIKGKGTFVLPPKATYDVGGLLRVLARGVGEGTEVHLLEARRENPQGAVRDLLGLAADERVLRVTAAMHVDAAPRALFWSFLSERDAPWLADLAFDQAVLRSGSPRAEVELAHGEALVETSWCTEFEGSHLDLPVGSPVFVARCTEVGTSRAEPTTLRAVEMAWVVFRADVGRLRVRLGTTGLSAIGPEGPSVVSGPR
jgi:GntR family transcriptional regulator